MTRKITLSRNIVTKGKRVTTGRDHMTKKRTKLMRCRRAAGQRPTGVKTLRQTLHFRAFRKTAAILLRMSARLNGFNRGKQEHT